MRKELKLFLTALASYSRIPAHYSPELAAQSNKYFTLVGWIIGILGALVFVLSEKIFPKSISILLSMLTTMLLTGAFHEDGLADSADGFGGGSTKERILSIMKDSATGAYGVIALIFALGLKYAILFETSINHLPLVIIAGHTASRFIAISFLSTHKYARIGDPTRKSDVISQKMPVADLVMAGVFGLTPVLLLSPKYLLALIPMLFLRQVIGYYINKKINGYTGDVLGATQQITELVFYFAAYLISLWIFT